MYTPNQQKPAPTLGGVQQNFQYRLRNFIINDQFTIVEDLPRTKPIRQAIRAGQKGQYNVFLIRISSNAFEADLELFEGELNNLAIACPKDTQNFKGITLAFDGRKWVYVCGETTPIRDARQPDLTPPATPQDQTKTFIEAMIKDMEYLKKVNSPEYQITTKVLMNIAESITPGKALDIITAAKTQGYIIESAGVYRVP